MSYEAPPTLAANATEAVNKLISAIGTNYSTLANALLSKCYSDSGLGAGIASSSRFVSQDNIYKFIINQVIPITQRFDSGWVNHPTDPRGLIMKGVSLEMFRSRFKSILIDTSVKEVVDASAAVDRVLTKWRTDKNEGQQYLYQLLTDQNASALWIWSYMTSVSSRYPAAVAAIDPYLGYLFFEFCWTSGDAVYSNAEIDTLARSSGWNGSTTNWISFLIGQSDSTPKFTMNTLVKRALYINKLGQKDTAYLKGWMDRFVNNAGSNLDYLVVINENFNLNKKSLYTFTDTVKAYLEAKAATYKTLSINI